MKRTTVPDEDIGSLSTYRFINDGHKIETEGATLRQIICDIFLIVFTYCI